MPLITVQIVLIGCTSLTFKLNLPTTYTFDDIEKININAMKSAFLHYDERLYYIYNIIKPGFQNMRERLLSFKNLPKQDEKAFPEL